MKPVRVILIAAAVGSVLGTAWAFQREAQDAEARRVAEEAMDREAMTPPAAPAQAGVVKLPAVEGLPQYPGAFVRPMSQGANIDIAWFSTKDSVTQVLDFYEKELDAKGKLAVRHEFSPAAGYAGYMDLEDHRMHLISVLRQGDETMVFPSSSYPEKMLAGTASPPAGVPNIAGAEGPVSFDLSSGPQKKQMWMATFPGSVDEVTETWRKGLVEKGFNVKRSDEGGQAHLDAAGPGGGFSVAIRRESEKVAVMVTTGLGP